jgi:uncharacterized protein (DUF2236 family)
VSTDATVAAAEDLGLFGPGSVTWRVHADPAMLFAGLRALLLQTCHPVVMNGFAANSMYRHDPWGRLDRTGNSVDIVTYGIRAEGEATGARIRSLHARLARVTDEETGIPHRLDEPELLLWVHCSEVDSFLSTYRRCGGQLDESEADRYVTEMRASARLVGPESAALQRAGALSSSVDEGGS